MLTMAKVFAAGLVMVMSSGLVFAADAPTAPQEESLAELPHWPVGFMLPEHLKAKDAKPDKGPVKADIMVWTAPGAKRIAAMLVVPNNTDSKNFAEHAAFREVATKREIGIVYMRKYDTGIEWERKEPVDLNRMPALLEYVAQKTGIPEFRHAPWITFGKSSRGSFPYRAAWLFPDRTIASVTYHGETPSWPVADFAKLSGQTIFSVNANGDSEWGGTWYNHVRPSLLNYRAKQGWLSHQVVVRGVGHGDYADANGSPGWGKPVPANTTSCLRVWDYLALFIDKAVALRVPQGKYATQGPVTLNQVDESTGYVIDPFAVEETFGVPHLPLKEGPGGYIANSGDEAPVTGFAALSPLKDFVPAPGVPVVAIEPGKSPKDWLLTDSLKFAMQDDPMVNLGDLAKLMPKPGDEVTIDGKTLAFKPIIPKYVGPEGGINLSTGLRPPNAKITLLAYTVLDIPARKTLRVQAGFTAATRVQLVINGIPVRHKQVLEFQPGKYPMLMVLRMTANWGRIEPSLGDVTEADIKLAREMQAEADASAAELAKKKAQGQPPRVLIRKASEVSKAERAKMFWVADKDMVDAWLKLHQPLPR